jgi:uncharacterized protein
MPVDGGWGTSDVPGEPITGHAAGRPAGGSTEAGGPEVRIDAPAGRFNLYVAGQLAGYLRYSLSDGSLRLLETTVSRQHRIENLAPVLITGALETARRKQLSVLPVSAAVRDFILLNPRYLDLVPADRRDEFGL